MKQFSKIMLSFMAVLTLCLCFTQTVKADANVSYMYCQISSEAEPKWYEGDPVIGPKNEIAMSDMLVSDSSMYYITAEPSLEVLEYLNNLEKADYIQIVEGGALEELVLGTPDKPVCFRRVSLTDANLTLTVYAEKISEVFVPYGSCNIFGDVSHLTLGSESDWTIEHEQNIMVDGNVDTLEWYRSADPQCNSFKGTLTVSGTVTEGKIHDRVEVKDFGYTNPITYTFSNATGNIISNGVLADGISCTVTDFADAEYSYQYNCYCWDGWTGNYWEMYVFANETEYIGTKFLENFEPTDLPDGANLLVQGNYGDEAIVIPKSLSKLHVDGGGEVIVQGDVDKLVVAWHQEETSLYKQNIDVTVTGNVTDADISVKEGSPVSVTVNGNVTDGNYNYINYFSDSGLIVKDGWLQVPVYSTLVDAQNKDVVSYIKPTTDVLNAAANVSDTDVITSETGAVLATRKVKLSVTENMNMDSTARESFEARNHVDILGVLDVVLTTGYYTVAEDYLYVDSTHDREVLTELPAKIPLTFTIPVDAQDSTSVFSVIREHEGVYDVLSDTDSDPTTVTVLTDRFSVYMLVKSDSLPEISIEPEEPPVPPVVGFVTRMYEQCLGRTPDQTGLNGWVSQLEGGYMDGAAIAEQFVFSKEMLAKNLSNRDFVMVLYKAMMGREADEGGLNGWVQQLDNKYMTRSEITKAFVESAEFTGICTSYGIIRGDYDATMAPIEHFVTRFYTLCLERNADQTGLYGWVDNLKNKYMNGAQIANSFFFSTEFVNKNVSNEKYVELLYNTLMGRPADTNGKNGWVSQLEGSHMTREDMMKAFIESTEFTNICLQYGISRGTL